MKRNKIKSVIITSNIKDIITNSKKRAMFTFSITPTGCFYYNESEVLTEEEMGRLYPVLSTPIRLKGRNIDTTKYIYE